jgi:predicted AAA+ superfamily ATPase
LKLIPDKFKNANVVNEAKFKKIYNETHGNLKLIISYINQYLLEAMDPELIKKHPNSYRLYLCSLLNLAIKGDIKDLGMIRSMIMIVYQSPVTWSEYTHHFIDLISLSKLSSEKKFEIVKMTSEVDHRSVQSKINYCHYEALIFQLMEILHGF